MTLLAIGAGGAIGAVARYLLGGWIQSATGGGMPWGTLSVNVLGSLALGFTMVWLHGAVSSDTLRQFLVIGVFGSFTTFSTYSYESMSLIREGDLFRAGGYMLGSLALGLIAVVVGAALASGMAGSRG